MTIDEMEALEEATEREREAFLRRLEAEQVRPVSEYHWPHEVKR